MKDIVQLLPTYLTSNLWLILQLLCNKEVRPENKQVVDGFITHSGAELGQVQAQAAEGPLGLCKVIKDFVTQDDLCQRSSFCLS